ncbi:MAG: class F sortase [Acidimicrobiia bacterium]
MSIGPGTTGRSGPPGPPPPGTLAGTPGGRTLDRGGGSRRHAPLPSVAEPVAALAPPPAALPAPQDEPVTRASSQATVPRPAPTWIASAGPLAASIPVRVDIPGIGTTAPIGPLGLNPDGTMEVPTDFSRAGYYRRTGPRGQPGRRPTFREVAQAQ